MVENNHMKASPGMSHILQNNKKTEKVTINGVVLTTSVEEKLEKHIPGTCSKASQKIHILSRITSHMSLNKPRFFQKTFVESQFNYYPLIWVFHSRRLNNKINNVYNKALRIVYSHY